MWSDITVSFREYMGQGMIVVLYFFCLIYLFVKEDRKFVRVVFICVPVCILLLYFNPLFYSIVSRTAEDEIYYRILWLLPLTAGIAYTACRMYGELKGRMKYAAAAGAVAIIMLSGRCVYDSPYFVKAENKYHMPDSVVHICDSIIVPGREVMAVFPRELLQYVRQYSALVCMPYGRETLVERWYASNELSRAMERNPAVLEELAPLALEAGCHYIILEEEKEILGTPRDFGWEIFGQTDGYTIYRDTTVPLVIPEMNN